MNDADLIDIVRAMQRTVGQKDWGGLRALIADDFEVCEAPSLPYGGLYRGPDGFVELIQKLYETWELKIDPQDPSRRLDVINDIVVSRSILRATGRRTGIHFEHPHVEFLRIVDGRIKHLEVFYWDTALVAAAAGSERGTA